MQFNLEMPVQFLPEARFELSQDVSAKDIIQRPGKFTPGEPYIIKNAILINEGIHNGDFYPAHELERSLGQFEGLALFKDHHNNNIGGTVDAWTGEVRNPRWNSRLRAVVGDLFIVDDILAKHLHYGAKFGLSVTVDADIRKNNVNGKQVALDPMFRSCSFVLDPAVRQTMLNENKAEVVDTDIENKPASADEGLAQKMASLEAQMEELRKKYPQAPGQPGYPYPKKSAMEMSDEELEAELARRKKVIPPCPPGKMEADPKVAELEAKLKEYQQKESAAKVEGVLGKEIKIGLLDAKDSTAGKARAEELVKLSAESLSAVEANLDRILKAMEQADTAPAPVALPQLAANGSAANVQRREYSRQELDDIREQSNVKFHNIMLNAQSRAM